MGLKNKIFKQFEQPEGRLGKLVRWVMSVSNKEMLKWQAIKCWK